MKKVENECVGCAVPAYPCLGDACPRRHVVRHYCDKCGEECEPEALYVTEDEEELCATCVLENYPTVKECRR